MISYKKVVKLFETANKNFLEKNKSLFETKVSERTLCGALMLELSEYIKEDEEYKGYYTDVEYNRNKGSIKTIKKTVVGNDEKIITINCDLIVHSRGEIVKQDNLLAVEMKKSTRPISEKDKDRERLIALTKDSFDDVWAWDGHNLPEHVCRYVLGVYYEINYGNNTIYTEYYQKGRKIAEHRVELY